MTRVQGAAGAPPAAPCEPAPPPPVKPDLRAGLVVVLLLALATGIVRGDLGSALLTAYALALALALGLRRPLPSLTCAYLGVQLVRWICLRAAGVPLLPFSASSRPSSSAPGPSTSWSAPWSSCCPWGR